MTGGALSAARWAREDPAVAHERQALEARTADLGRRETALAERERCSPTASNVWPRRSRP